MEILGQEHHLRFKALFEMATDGIITMNTMGIIENVNQATCDLFGYRAEELRGQKINILMNSHDRNRHDGYLERYLRTREPRIIGVGREVTGRCKDGREFPLRLAVSEVRLDDGILYTGILHDLSDFRLAQRRVEELNKNLENKVIERTAELRRREYELQQALGKEKELSELKSRFLSMASHEFKTPLSTILSSAEIVELYVSGDQQNERRFQIERIKRAVDQLTEVLDDFLSLSKLEQGKTEVKLRLVDLSALLSSCVEAAEGQLLPGQRILLTVPDELPKLVTDPKLLLHVIANLISNAAKYSHPDQEIDVEVRTVGKKSVLLLVKDRGIGIPVPDQEYLFDRFFRASNVENVKGTGLGLNIVAHYVQLLGGSITCASKLGEGSVFTVRLPITD